MRLENVSRCTGSNIRHATFGLSAGRSPDGADIAGLPVRVGPHAGPTPSQPRPVPRSAIPGFLRRPSGWQHGWVGTRCHDTAYSTVRPWVRTGFSRGRSCAVRPRRCHGQLVRLWFQALCPSQRSHTHTSPFLLRTCMQAVDSRRWWCPERGPQPDGRRGDLTTKGMGRPRTIGGWQIGKTSDIF